MSDPGAPTNIDPAGFIAQLVMGDVAATRALGEFRAAGMAMRTQSFYQLYGEIRDAVGGRSALQGMDYAQLPTGAQYTTYRAGEGGQYATFTQTYVRDVGSSDVRTMHRIYITDTPHTANEALNYALDSIVAGEGQSGPPGGETVIGQTVSSMTATEPRLA